MQIKSNYGFIPLLAVSILASGCAFESDSKTDNAETQPQTQTTTPPAPAPQPPDISLEVNLAERQVHVHKGGQIIASHPVAVGSAEWPTPTGEWTIGQVIFNPRWTPPKDESWAEDEKVAEPGAPDNPLGQVQLVYSPPNSIHGTNEPSSLGKAVSHGSIRISNEDGIALAKLVMASGGAPKDDSWVQSALANKTEREEVVIPNPVPIRVVSGK